MTIEEAGSSGAAGDLDLFEAEATGHPVKTETPSKVPDKYVGKTVDDLIKMHQNSEQLNGRQGNELGQMRRMADEILQLKKPTTQKTEQVRQPVTVDLLLNDPEKAISQALENSPLAHRARAAEERAAQLEARITESEFKQSHANIEQDINDPVFLEWVNKNPLRQALASSSANNLDVNRFTAAKNLWDLWDEHKDIVGMAHNKPALQGKAKTVPNTVRSAPTGLQGKPNWSRAKLMELRSKVADGDPSATARWSDKTFQERMHTAYAEDRVV